MTTPTTNPDPQKTTANSLSTSSTDWNFPDQDKMMLWANANAEAIVRQVFPDAPEGLQIRIKWFPIVGRHEDRPPTQVDMIIRATLTETYYVTFQHDDPDLPKSIPQERTLYSKTVCLMFHQFILSIGKVIKELKALSDTYEYDSAWGIVSGDSTYAEVLEQQDIHFIQAPGKATR